MAGFALIGLYPICEVNGTVSSEERLRVRDFAITEGYEEGWKTMGLRLIEQSPCCSAVVAVVFEQIEFEFAVLFEQDDSQTGEVSAFAWFELFENGETERFVAIEFQASVIIEHDRQEVFFSKLILLPKALNKAVNVIHNLE